MKKDELLQKLKELVSAQACCEDPQYRAGVCAAAQVDAGKLHEVMVLFNQAGYFLESVTGMDFEDTLELVYHVNCYEPHSRIAIRVAVGHDQAPPPTISDLFPAALWHEREAYDFFGVEFADHPDLRHLLLPEDADYQPLRKNFGKVNAYRKREEIYG